VGHNAVQQALSILAERGLIERRSKRGTFVSEHINSRTIGVVFEENIVAEQYSQFHRLLYGEIVRQARLQNWRTVLYFPVTGDSHAQHRSQLERDITAGKLRAVINFDNSTAMNDYLDSSSCVSIRFNYSIESDDDMNPSMAYRGTNYLLEQGYRNIVMVLHPEHELNNNILKRFKAAYSDKNLPYSGNFHIGKQATEQQGIEITEQLLANPSRPEALLVLNDTICKGIIFTLMHRGINIPDDIALMVQTNKGHEILSPVPLTKLEFDPEAIIKANIEHLLCKIAGKKFIPSNILPKLIIGKSCGE
jgi:DNA-binding LacI/PurR family transcriptional regulator